MRKRSEKFSLSQYDKESEFAQRYPEKSKEIFGSDPGFCGLNAVFWIVVNVLMFIFAVYVCVMLIDSKYKWDRLSDQKTQFENLESTFLKYQKGDQKGEANGYVPLNELGKIPLIFLSLVSEEITLFLGCWNANTNDPIIVSSIGQGSEQYITCESGNT